MKILRTYQILLCTPACPYCIIETKKIGNGGNDMTGLALEGGGAKGAFHMGAIKALFEEGYHFDVITGTSIGAFNGAIVAQGDFELGYSLWENMTTSMLFDVEDEKLENILSKKLDLDTLGYMSSKIREFITNKGLDTVRIKKLLDEYIDEQKLRTSTIDLGIITVSLTDFKPLELYKEDIPTGQMTSYLMASANLPFFKLEPLAGKYFIDGGIYDNCPINLLVKKDCTDSVAIRTYSIGFTPKPLTQGLSILNILPSEDLGAVLIFDKALIQRNLKMGYYDAKRALYGLKGRKYYISPIGNAYFLEKLCHLSPEFIFKISSILSLPLNIATDPTRLLFEKILPKLYRMLKLDNSSNYEDLIIALLETSAEEKSLERFQIYNFNTFLDWLTSNQLREEKSLPQKNILLKISSEWIKMLYENQ